MTHKVLIMSDVHLCCKTWYGLSSPDRMEKMVQDLNALYARDPYDAIFFLGDYSLDHWNWETKGSVLHEGVSNTHKLIRDYLSRLHCQNQYLLPGNHEQYGHETWEKITGRKRQYTVAHDGYLFIMLDTFGADLDPSVDSDGTYLPVDVDYVRRQLDAHPGMPALLCAHYFDLRKESDAFTRLVRDEKRILALFCGHDHLNRVEILKELGGTPIIHDGHFSYSLTPSPADCPWGWLEVLLEEKGIRCTYFHPAADMTPDEGPLSIHAGHGPMIQLERKD